MSRIRRYLSFFLVLFCPAWSAVAANQVVCIGLDGHIRVESATAGNCADYDADTHLAETSSAFRSAGADNTHCGACVDLPIASDNGVVTNQQSDSKRLTQFAPQRDAIHGSLAAIEASNAAAIGRHWNGYPLINRPDTAFVRLQI